ncbi:MAG: hypothetical protein HY834_09085 [Devosia nanyangense]|uniref:Uncharacterized protein n=1 Tax=Devosia nanyangense TaxID=1228055 RepID=A0A933NY47_9HYPH|nr:hypothetical protein [Devosia nanyangense]
MEPSSPPDPSINLLAAMRAQTVDIFDFETGELIMASAPLRDSMGDDEEAYRDALAELSRAGSCIVGGGAAAAFLVKVAQ